jgi:hypothetical protein
LAVSTPVTPPVPSAVIRPKEAIEPPLVVKPKFPLIDAFVKLGPALAREITLAPGPHNSKPATRLAIPAHV